MRRNPQLRSEPTIWQQFSQVELDRTVQVMISLRLIKRRRVWVLVQGRGLLRVRGSVKPSWEYRITKPGELVLRVLNLLTRWKVLPA
jgi:hypothetical protein